MDDDYLSHFNTNFLHHAGLLNSRSINFFDNSFENLQTTSNTWLSRGYAIQMLGCRRVIILGNENGDALGRFDGFSTGVLSANSRGVRIFDNLFARNRIGTHFLGCTSVRFQNNDVRIGLANTASTLNADLQYDFKEGLLLESTTRFITRGNSFNGYDADPFLHLGSRCLNTNTCSDVLRDNSYENLDVANLANGNNAAGSNGLRYFCNQKVGNTYDFRVSTTFGDNSPFPDTKIAKNQGTQDILNNLWIAAGNTFSTNTNQFNDFWNEPQGEEDLIVYHYWPFENDQIPVQISGNVNAPPASIERQCQSNAVPNQNDYESALSEADAWEPDYQDIKYLRLALLDGGDTEALQEEVEDAWSNDTWEVRADLLAKSPYLTKETLYKVADRTDLLPHPVALEIFIANPTVLRKDAFISYLSTKPDPMPAYMIDILIASRDQESFREQIEEDYASYEALFLAAIDEAVYNGLGKENPITESEMLDLYERAENLQYELLIADVYLADEDVTQARNTLNRIPTHTLMNTESRKAKLAFEKWIDFVEGFSTVAWEEESELSETQLDMLHELVNDYRYEFAGAKAAAALEFYAGENHYIPPHVDDDVTPKSFGTGGKPKAELTWELGIYPNPAQHAVNLELPLEWKGKVQSLMLINAQGQKVKIWEPNKLLHHVWNVADLSSGAYEVIIHFNNGNNEIQKLQIIH